MNLLLKFTCINWNGVDLEFLIMDFEQFWFCFWFESFSKWFCLRIRWFTKVDTRCKPRNRYGFQRFLQFFMISNQNSSNSPQIYIDLDSLLFSNMQEVSFWFSPGFIWRFDFESSECFDLDFVCWFWDRNPKINRWFVFLLLNRFRILEILSLFFFSTLGFLWSCWIRCFWQWIQCLNCRNTGSVMKIQFNLWELHVNSIDFGSICFWKIVRVFGNVLQFLEFVMILIQLNGERKLVSCFWLGIDFVDLSSDWYSNRPYIGCHVASGPMRFWHLDWYLLAWPFDLSCKDLRTKMQFEKK